MSNKMAFLWAIGFLLGFVSFLNNPSSIGGVFSLLFAAFCGSFVCDWLFSDHDGDD